MTTIESDGVDHWTWDVKARGSEIRALGQRNPTNSPTNAEYHLYKNTGGAWTRQNLFTPAFTFPLYAGQPNYTGGMCFDQGNWDKLFIALPSGVSNGINMTEWYVNPVTGAKRKLADIAFNSQANMYNCRPQAPINWTSGHPRVTWWRGRYTTYLNYDTAVMVYK
jgi:hypothetical protein